MEWIFLYLGIALVDWSCDGAMCYLGKRKFKVWKSFWACLFWPITAPIEVAGAAAATKDYPEW